MQLIGRLQDHHPRKHLQWQLARIMALNLLILYTLIFALFGKVNDMVSGKFSFSQLEWIISRLLPIEGLLLPDENRPNSRVHLSEMLFNS